MVGSGKIGLRQKFTRNLIWILIVNFVGDSKKAFMNARQIKEEIHDFINHADERFLRLVYSMVKSEKSENAFFDTTDGEMVERAKKSLVSVENGKKRNIREFKKDIESWKENRSIQ